jgi:hypothetical protein
MLSLIFVDISGFASPFREILNWNKGHVSVIAGGISLCTILALLCRIHFVDYLNRVLFVGAFIIAGLVTLALSHGINGQRMPFLFGKCKELSSWSTVGPVIFPSFGFEVVFHIVINYRAIDKEVLHRVFIGAV